MNIRVIEKYHYIESKKMTVCILKVNEKDKERYKRILEGLNILEKHLPNGGIKKSEIKIPSTFKGVVTLKEGDKFDKKIGKTEARNAAYRKLDNWFVKFSDIILNSIEDLHEVFIDEKFNNSPENIDFKNVKLNRTWKYVGDSK